jgi:hypothetical protein
MTLWKYQTSSPTGKWVALAQTDNTDTLGNVEYTKVRVKDTSAWRSAKTLVVFDGGIDEQEDFQMKWDTPSHIDIIVREYGSPVPYRSINDRSPVTFSVHSIQKPYHPTQ